MLDDAQIGVEQSRALEVEEIGESEGRRDGRPGSRECELLPVGALLLLAVGSYTSFTVQCVASAGG